MSPQDDTAKFDLSLSLQIDRATVALEAAKEKKDKVRAACARLWKARLEAQMEKHDEQ